MKLFAFLFCVTCSFFATGQSTSLAPTAFSTLMQEKNIQLLDVRTAEEYKTDHLANALQADWTSKSSFKERTAYLDKGKKLLVYCASGGRSAAAAKALRSQGYQVYELKGGMIEWKKAGLPVEGSAVKSSMSLPAYQQAVSRKGWVLVDFGAPWCPPCRKMKPVLDSLQQEKAGAFTLLPVDGGLDIEPMKAMQVESLPHFFLYKDGKLVWQKQGMVYMDEFRKIFSF